MDIRILKNDDEIYILEPCGGFDLRVSNRIKELVMKLMEKKTRGIIVDLKHVTTVKSEGVGALINISSTLKKLNCALAITNVSAGVQQTMEILKLSGYLPITATLKDAVDQIQASS